MRFNEPKILSQEADNQNGLSGVKYSYADGSFGFKAHASKNLIVTSPDNTVTTYNSELIRIKEEKQGHTFEYHEDGESVKKEIFYNPENKNINAEKYLMLTETKFLKLDINIMRTALKHLQLVLKQIKKVKLRTMI